MTDVTVRGATMQSSVKVNRNSHTCVTELTLGLVVVCNTVHFGIDPILFNK